MLSKAARERGFSYPELLVVVIIILIVFFWTVPIYKKFSAINELKNTSQEIRNQLRAAQNKAASGVTAANGRPAHWVVNFHSDTQINQYEKAACPVVTDSSAEGYADRYTFDSCPNRSDNEVFDFPSHFSITHQYTGSDEVGVFFSSINGAVSVYDEEGVYLGNSVDIRISSDEYTDMYVILHVNESGNISEERLET